MPLVSVIMSVYNGMPFLAQSVKSILNQSYKNFEFIIIDDGSTDKSFSFLKKIKDKRLTVIKNKKNIGLANSLNVALKKTKGNLIARMDSDDISLKNRFKEQVNFLRNHKDIDVCGTWAGLINAKGEKIGIKKMPTDDKLIKKSIKSFSPIIHPTMMAKAKFFRNLNGYRPEFDYAEDYDLLIRAKNKFKMANIPKTLFLWRLWDDRRSRKYMKQVDLIDTKIKIRFLKDEDFSFIKLLIVTKKVLFTFLIPNNLKIKIAKLLKTA